MGDDAIHQAHCSAFRCVYGDPACPVNEEGVTGGHTDAALAVLREEKPVSIWDRPQGRCPGEGCWYALPLDDAGLIMGHSKAGTLETCEGGGKLPLDEAEIERQRLAALGMTEEYAVRATSQDWVYSLPRIIPKALWGKRGTREAAEWHLTKVAGKDPEDQKHFEIVTRPVGPWKVVS